MDAQQGPDSRDRVVNGSVTPGRILTVSQEFWRHFEYNQKLNRFNSWPTPKDFIQLCRYIYVKVKVVIGWVSEMLTTT
jgi:hypothetical protein